MAGAAGFARYGWDMEPDLAWIEQLVRSVPDFPEPGIVYRDITPLLADADGFRFCVEAMSDRVVGAGIELVVGVDARGFILGAPIACRLGCGFAPIRKAGKLPSETIGLDYELEYGTGRLELHADTVTEGQRVLLVDDVLATGGTAKASIELLRTAGADLVGVEFLIELLGLGGREKLPFDDPYALISFE